MRKLVELIVIISSILILMLTLFPFNFSFTAQSSIQEVIKGFHHISNPRCSVCSFGIFIWSSKLCLQKKIVGYSCFLSVVIVLMAGILQSLLAMGNKTDFNLNNCFLSIAIAVVPFLLVKNKIIFKNSSTFTPVQ